MPPAALRQNRFDAGVRAALDALGARADAEVTDGLVDPAALASRLASSDGEPIVVRAAPAAATATPGYGPEPAPWAWLCLRGGSADVSAVAFGERTARRGRMTDVRVSVVRLPCCGDANCKVEKHLGRVTIAVDGSASAERERAAAGATSPNEWIVGETLAASENDAREPLEPLAASLAALAKIERFADERARDSKAARQPLGSLPAVDLARFAMRWEGEQLVLRDWASQGPRERVPRLTGVGIVLALVAVPLWVLVARVRTEWSLPSVLGLASVAAIVSLAAYAFLGVASFARKYVATSAPLFRLMHGRVTAMPWVSRTGAVDLRQEGRFGAAIPLGEVKGSRIVARGAGVLAVELDTDHGPIDVLTTSREAVASYWRAALERVTAIAAHPDLKASARQRARARSAKPAHE